MTNRILAVGAVLVLFASAGWATEDSHGKSVADVESEIRIALGLSDEDPIDPELVPDELLIELGDAVMGYYVGDPVRHEWMDEMMGGEGSESLDAAHRWMAYRYLAGGYAETQGFGMGGGMMGGGMMSGWGLMGNPAMMFDDIPYDSPERILQLRYARGEISRREYRRSLRDLQ